MNRAVVAGAALLVILFLLSRRTKREPKCHYVYGCTNNLPDWSYWQSQ